MINLLEKGFFLGFRGLAVFLMLAAMSIVFGCGGGGGGGTSGTVPPTDVTGLSATPGDTKVSLSWTGSSSSNLAGYKVYQKASSASTYSLVASSVSSSATSYVATGLTNETSYTFKVTAYDTSSNESSGATVSCYANAALADSSFITNSGVTNGGAARESTQTMAGSVPNPTGSTDTYQGKAYLVLNGDRIPLAVTKSTSELQGRKIYKEGKEYSLDDSDKINAALPRSQASARATVSWVFSVTFSLNAGSNTVNIEVYDLNSTLFARTDRWDIVGVIQPTSLMVTLWWDTNQTDIDLHMSPDNGGTHCYYSHMTAGDMKLDYDDVNGYGPEHITVDQATGTKIYKIKVYYYADHNTNTPPSTTPTTAYVTASVNGQLKLSGSQLMTVASTASGWMSGAHVWEVGEVEVSAPDRYTVVLGAPDINSFPTVKLTVTVTDPNNTENPKVTGLGSSNFYVINAGRVMSPVTVSAADNVYTLNFSDVIAGKRDIFVYAVKPAQGTTQMKAGLSNTNTYGTNYALLAGLNEYPAQAMGTASWIAGTPDYVQVTVDSTRIPDGAGDFTLTFTDSHGIRAAVSVTPNSITPAPAAGVTSYRLDFTQPAHYSDYDRLSVTYKKQIWLSWCVKDVTDLKSALLAKGTGMSNTSWDSANITTYTNSTATKDTILNKIQTIAGTMQKYDLFLFHFSGHGSGMPADGNAAQYLCAYEDGKWISVNDLKAKLDLIPNAGGGITNAFVMMDACHSGNFIAKEVLRRSVYTAEGQKSILKYRPFVPQIGETPGNLKTFLELRDLTSLTNTFVMAAQTGTSSAWDDGTLQNGVFTHYLVEGINVSGKRVSEATANSDHDPWITGEEAFAYLDPKAQARVTTANGYSAGDFQRPQVQDNSTSTRSIMIYNW